MNEPFINLIGAIIKQAISDLVLSDKTLENARNKKSAEQFFAERGSLDVYCSICGVCADYVREVVKNRKNIDLLTKPVSEIA